MNFSSATEHADYALTQFRKNPLQDQSLFPDILYEKIDKCPYEIILICSGYQPFKYSETNHINFNVLFNLHQAWSICNDPDSDLKSIQEALVLVNRCSKQVSIKTDNWGFRVRRYQNDLEGNIFFLLLDPQESEGISSQYLRILCNLWQVEMGRIPLHASGIIYRGELYLFSGPSGAGKSTVAGLSTGIGGEILDEDQLMIYLKPDGRYAANAWGYSLQTSDVPIKAFFRLVKDQTDQLIPLSITNTAHLLMEQSYTITGNSLPENEFVNNFRRVAELGRSIPGYELHFRKSPDFWKLIDAELSGQPCEGT